MKRYAAQVEYFGKSYFGWQRQRGLSTVQSTLETALSIVANQDIEVFCAGRTDAAVHASGQIIHFESNSPREIKNWFLGVNSNLPPEVRVRWIVEVSSQFHARFSATSRKYRYIILQEDMPSCFLMDRVTWINKPLNILKMREAAQSLLGEQDFSSFRAANCQSSTPMRNITNVSVKEQGKFIIFEIEANAFLYHMVRNIMGSLLDVGFEKKTLPWFHELILKKDRSLASPTAPPSGLYLVGVSYPIKFGELKVIDGPCFI
jgi:tRNA pseudouridine38-40 synthase